MSWVQQVAPLLAMDMLLWGRETGSQNWKNKKRQRDEWVEGSAVEVSVSKKKMWSQGEDGVMEGRGY